MTMKRRRRSVAAAAAAAAVLALLVGSTSQASVGGGAGERASATCPVGLRCAFDRVYGSSGTPPVPHYADIYAPAESVEPPPVVLLVHGGGWFRGLPDSLRSEAIYFAHNGFAAVVIDYTLAVPPRYGDVPSWPTAVQDVAMATRWIADHAADYDIDGSNLAIFGGSAGGHLATLVAMSADEGLPNGPAPIKTVVSWSGAMLLHPYYAGPTQEPRIEWFLGCTYDECPDRWELASPITHVDADPPGNPDDPSMQFFNGEFESAPIKTAELMRDALVAAGIEHEFVKLFGVYEHAAKYECALVTIDGQEDMVIDHTVRWLGEHLLADPLPPTGDFGPYCPELDRRP